MTDVHQCSKVDFPFLFFLCLQKPCFSLFSNTAFCFFFGQLPSWQPFEILTHFVHCCCRIRNVHRLRHKNKFVHKIVMTQRIEPLSCNVVFMIFRWNPFQTLSRGLMSFYDACVLCFRDFVGPVGFAVNFSLLELTFHRLQLSKYCGFHGNFQLVLAF